MVTKNLRSREGVLLAANDGMKAGIQESCFGASNGRSLRSYRAHQTDGNGLTWTNRFGQSYH